MSADVIPVVARFAAILTATGVVLWLLERRWHTLTRFRDEPVGALDLAVARVAIMVAVLVETRLPPLLAFARLDRVLLLPPRGWAPFVGLIPLGSPGITGAYIALVVTAILAIVGWRGRLMCALTTALAFYLNTIPQLFGKVNHTANHLVLFGVLLACSPCCDALAIDARRARRPDERAYATAIHTMMLLIACAYFFPGAWKLARLGTQWFTSDNMRWLILTKLEESSLTPVREWVLDRPWLLSTMAVGTVVFELGFLFVILSRKLRPAAVVVGIAFHTFTAAVMGIQFTTLELSYVVFIPWTELAARAGVARQEAAATADPGRTSVAGLRAVAALILGGVVLAGSLHLVRTWPIACYPPFDIAAIPTVDALAVATVDAHGRSQGWVLSFDPVAGDRFGSDRWRGLTASVLANRPAFDPRRAAALYRAWSREHALTDPQSATFFAVTYALETPFARTPLARRTLGTWSPSPQGEGVRGVSVPAP